MVTLLLETGRELGKALSLFLAANGKGRSPRNRGIGGSLGYGHRGFDRFVWSRWSAVLMPFGGSPQYIRHLALRSLANLA